MNEHWTHYLDDQARKEIIKCLFNKGQIEQMKPPESTPEWLKFWKSMASIYRDEYEKQKSRIEEQDKEIIRLHRIALKSNTDVVEMCDTITNKNKEIKELERKVTNLNRAVANGERICNELSFTNDNLKMDINLFRDSIEARDKQIENDSKLYYNRLREEESRVKGFIKANEGYKAQIYDQENRIEEQFDKIKELKKWALSFQNSSKNWYKKFREEESKVRSFKKEIKSLKKEVKELNAKISRLVIESAVKYYDC